MELDQELLQGLSGKVRCLKRRLSHVEQRLGSTHPGKNSRVYDVKEATALRSAVYLMQLYQDKALMDAGEAQRTVQLLVGHYREGRDDKVDEIIETIACSVPSAHTKEGEYGEKEKS